MYKGLEIATNKATQDEMQAVTHHLFDFLDLEVEYKVTDFVKDALSKVKYI